MTSPRTILSAIAVAAALTIGLAPAAHAGTGTSDPTDAVGTASPEPTPAETDEPVVEPTDEPTDDPDPTSEPSVEPTTVVPPPDPTTSVVPPQPTSSSTPMSTPTSTTTTGSSTTPTSTTSVTPSPTSSTPAPVFYEHCAAVHDAGQPFLFSWEPGYRTELDPDLDGIACEWREHLDGNDESTDNDWRTLVIVIPVTVDNSSYTYYGDDDLNATYTQWPTVPDGPIATGAS